MRGVVGGRYGVGGSEYKRKLLKIMCNTVYGRHINKAQSGRAAQKLQYTFQGCFSYISLS